MEPVAADLMERARSGDGGRVPGTDRAVPSRAPGALLPDARILPGRRRRPPGHVTWPPGRASAGYEGRASVRTWLYRIATNRCLNMLRSAKPTSGQGVGACQRLNHPSRPGSEKSCGSSRIPTAFSKAQSTCCSSPEARYEQTDAISLAFVTALQVLPARQRAVLILCEVLGYRANEVADMLDSTVDSVNNALKRARSSLHTRAGPSANPPPAPDSPSEQALVARFVRAPTRPVMWQRSSALLTEDVPESPCHQSRSNTKVSTWSPASTPAFSAEAAGPMTSCPRCGRTARLHSELTFAVPTGTRHGAGLLVLTLAGDRICAMTRFDNSVLA